MEWRIIVAVLCLSAATTLVTSEIVTPVANQTTTPVTNQAATPVTNHTATPVTNQTATPVTNQTATPVTNQTTTPVTNQTATPVTNHTATPVTNQTATPVTNQAATPVTNQTATPVTNQTATPVTNQAATPVTNQTATPDTNQTATPVTNQTATPVTTVPAPAKVAKFNLGFSIANDFQAIYSNLSNPETKKLSNTIITECSRVYKSRFPKFFRMFIRKFSKGSVVVDAELEFDSTNGASPNVTDVTGTLATAITNGNFSFKINSSTINTTDIPETSASLTDYNITFKLNDAFTNDLSNMSSDAATKLAKTIISELDGFYRGFKNFNRTLVSRFRSGSIDVDGLLGFIGSLANNPNATELAKGLAEAVRNGTVKLSVDPKTIKVTDPSGFSANRSPVLASMLTALWMTLASLLLSAVMH